VKPKKGDFVKSKHGLPVGLVLRVGSIPYGKRTIPGVVIDKGGGREDFIALDDLVIINRDGFSVNEPAKALKSARYKARIKRVRTKLSGNAKVTALRRVASQMLSRLGNKDMPSSMEIDKLRNYIDNHLNSDPQLIGVGFNAKIAANQLFHANTYPAMRAALVDLISICSEFDAGGLQR
jgi:hypothetical protein